MKKISNIMLSSFLICLIFISSCNKDSNQDQLVDQIQKNYKIVLDPKLNSTNTIPIKNMEEFNEFVKSAKSSLLEIGKEYKMSTSNGNQYKIDGEIYTLPAVNITGVHFTDYGLLYGGSGSGFTTFNLYLGATFNNQSNLFVTSQAHTSGGGSAIFGAQVIESYNATESNGKKSMYITVKVTGGVTIGGKTYGVVIGEFEYKVVKQTATSYYLYRLY